MQHQPADRSPIRNRLAPLVAAVATLTASSPALAYCRSTTVKAPAGYDPTASGCITQGTPLSWPSLPVTYQLDENASAQVTFGEANSILDRAFAKWAAVTCPFGDAGAPPALSFENLGPSDAGDISCDASTDCAINPHVVVFLDQGWPHSDPANTIALTTVSFNSAAGYIYSAEIEINSAQHMLSTTNAASDGFSLEAILTHEAGHFIGLAHSDVDAAVMYAFYQSTSLVLTPDDVAGVCAIYPPGSATSRAPLVKGCSCATVGPEGDRGPLGALAFGATGIAASIRRRRRTRD